MHDEVHEVAVGRGGVAKAVGEQLGHVQLLLDGAIQSLLPGRQATADLHLELRTAALVRFLLFLGGGGRRHCVVKLANLLGHFELDVRLESTKHERLQNHVQAAQLICGT